MSRFIFILACSGKKAAGERMPACDLYKGEIFLKGKFIAERFDIPYWILSAKYGIITSNDVIDNYDHKLAKPYNGPFPPNPYCGFYVGGQSYFKNFPDTFLPLVEPGPIGKMLQRLKFLQDSPSEAMKRMSEHPNYAAL